MDFQGFDRAKDRFSPLGHFQFLPQKKLEPYGPPEVNLDILELSSDKLNGGAAAPCRLSYSLFLTILPA